MNVKQGVKRANFQTEPIIKVDFRKRIKNDVSAYSFINNTKSKRLFKVIAWVVTIGLIFTAQIPTTLVTGFVMTNVFTTVFWYSAITFLIIAFIKRFNMKSRKVLIVNVIIFSVCMFITEIGLRLSNNRHQGYVEKNGNFFSNYYSMRPLYNLMVSYKPNPGEPNSVSTEDKAEFSFIRRFNNYGYNDSDFSVNKKPGEFRMLMLGDSWTEGIGADTLHSYPYLLQQKLSVKYPNVNVMNFGRSGNDPVYALKALRDNFMQFGPDMIVLAINNSDVIDVLNLGGLERYDKHGNLKFKTAPFWEYVYGYSYIVRFFVHDILKYNYMMLPEDRSDDEFMKATQKLTDAVVKMNEYCKENNIPFVLVVSPSRYEIDSRDTEYGTIYKFENGLDIVYYNLTKGRKFPIVFLTPYYMEKGMTYQNAGDYYWQKDYHHNQYGYELFASGVYEGIVPVLDSLKMKNVLH